MEPLQLFNGNCIEIMDNLIQQGVKVDAIITDMPYDSKTGKYDSLIPLEDMWYRVKQLIKENGVVALFGTQPFTSKLIVSNLEMFKYEIIWEKDKPTNFASANRQVMRYHENIAIFYNGQCTYNKQMTGREGTGSVRYNFDISHDNRKMAGTEKVYAQKKDKDNYDILLKNPKSVIYFSTGRRQDMVAPNQKPLELVEYLVRTFTNLNETVLDLRMHCGQTGIACKKLTRNYIGIESDKEMFELAKSRIEEVKLKKKLFNI